MTTLVITLDLVYVRGKWIYNAHYSIFISLRLLLLSFAFSFLSNDKTSKTRPRLIVTCTDIQTSNPVIYDSKNVDINVENVVASAGFPFYGISWTRLRYWIGEYTPGLKYNSDGSLDIYLQPQNPGQAKQNNWLPTPTSNQPFNLNFRMYWPDQQIVNGTWSPLPIQRANATG